jgi:thiamine biosynthesis lipoprotein
MKDGGGDVFRFAHEAMGTCFELLIAGKEETYSRQVSAAVFAEIDRLERLFSRFDPSSEVSQINRLKPGESLRIGLEVFECIQTAARIKTQTQGAFDINYKALLKRKKGAPAGPGKMKRNMVKWTELSKTGGGYSVRARTGNVGEKRMPLDLDLGGIGKGYALDKILDILEDWSVKEALIHSGTSTALAIGSAPDRKTGRRGWPVGIASGWECRKAPRKFYLRNRAVSGSGTEIKGRHIFNPRTGRPTAGHLAAWASHSSAAVADALSTAFMVMDTAEVEAYCKLHPDVWALVVTDTHNCELFNRKVIT